MPRIPYRFPTPGTDIVADRILERRGARGLTPLDGMLLNAPDVANGWNSFIGGLRNRTSLSDDVRELMILRVAACNSAAFEWIHHEHVGRKAGLTYEQLSVIGQRPYTTDSSSESLDLSANHTLSPLQSAALMFADESTRHVKVPRSVFDTLKTELGKNVPAGSSVEQLLTEAAAVVGGYNLVSRFLLSMDVGDFSDYEVPVPQMKDIEVPLERGSSETTTIRAIHIPACPHAAPKVTERTTEKKTLIFVNSLMTNFHMWDRCLSSFTESYDVILYDQRGHGQSSIPSIPCTMDQLSDDIASILDVFSIPQAEAVIGVSQGGATTLNFAINHPARAKKIVACDTQAKTPVANIKAWDDRITLARAEGMGALADATIPRWFTEESTFNSEKDGELVRSGVVKTQVEGFAAGAAALQNYDLLAKGLLEVLANRGEKRALLVAGEKDGAIPEALKKLAEQVQGGGVRVEVIPGGGHLPMINEPEKWSKAVLDFLKL